MVSSFDTLADGWQIADMADNGPFVTPISLTTPTYSSSGGNPGGCVSSVDPSGNTFYWQAPARYLGDQSGAYGQTLAWDQRHTGSSSYDNKVDIILVGAGLVLVRGSIVTPNVSWQTYSVRLVETGWHLNSSSGAEPTAAQFQSVLASLSVLRIRGEYTSGSETDYLDNVRLAGAVLLTLQILENPRAAQLSFEMAAGQGYTLLGSPSLTVPADQWEVLGSWNGAGTANFTDHTLGSQPRRFYRVRMP